MPATIECGGCRAPRLYHHIHGEDGWEANGGHRKRRALPILQDVLRESVAHVQSLGASADDAVALRSGAFPPGRPSESSLGIRSGAEDVP